MPLYRRLPKRGFTPHGGKTEFALVNLRDLAARFPADSVVDPDALVANRTDQEGRAPRREGPGRRRTSAHALVVKTHRISEAAREKLEAAGGRVEVIPA